MASGIDEIIKGYEIFKLHGLDIKALLAPNPNGMEAGNRSEQLNIHSGKSHEVLERNIGQLGILSSLLNNKVTIPVISNTKIYGQPDKNLQSPKYMEIPIGNPSTDGSQ